MYFPICFCPGIEGELTSYKISETLQSPGSPSWQFPELEGPSQNTTIVAWFQWALAEVVGKRRLWRVFSHFPSLLSSTETCSSDDAHGAGGQPGVLTGKLWSGQQRGRGGWDEPRAGKRADVPKDGSHLLRATIYKLGHDVHLSFVPWTKWEIMWKQEDLPSERGSQELTKQRHLFR